VPFVIFCKARGAFPCGFIAYKGKCGLFPIATSINSSHWFVRSAKEAKAGRKPRSFTSTSSRSGGKEAGGPKRKRAEPEGPARHARKVRDAYPVRLTWLMS
jgi:hypothetical protein